MSNGTHSVPAGGRTTPSDDSFAARASRALSKAPVHVIMIGICLLWLLPTLGLLVSSFRPNQAITSTGWWTAFADPGEFTLENYQRVISTQGMGRSFMNSLIIAGPATVFTVLVAALAAYAFSWIRFRGRDWLFLLVVGLLVVPIQLTLIPILRMFAALGITGTFPAVWLAHTAYGLPFAVLLLRNFFIALPKDLLESAFLEGANHWTAFRRIILPLSVPSIAALSIFQFLWLWNDLLVSLVYLGGVREVAPMTVTISNLVSSYGSSWHLLTAAAFVSMVLPLAIFFALQRYFVEGILAGAVKG